MPKRKKINLNQLKNDFSLEALESSPFTFTPEAAGLVRRRTEKAFLAGARAIISILKSETARIAGSIEDGIGRRSDFERGTAEGVRWLAESVLDKVEE